MLSQMLLVVMIWQCDQNFLLISPAIVGLFFILNFSAKGIQLKCPNGNRDTLIEQYKKGNRKIYLMSLDNFSRRFIPVREGDCSRLSI